MGGNRVRRAGQRFFRQSAGRQRQRTRVLPAQGKLAIKSAWINSKETYDRSKRKQGQIRKQSERQGGAVVGAAWLAGTLFTIGFSPYPADLDLWRRVGQWLFYFIA